MRILWRVGILLLAFFFFYYASKSKTSHTLLVQAVVDSPVLAATREKITPLINSIIKEELGLSPESTVSFFSPKQLNRLTLYYINDIHETDKQAIIDALNASQGDQHSWSLNNIAIKSEVDFFGGPFANHDELVIMVNDSNNELQLLNDTIKSIAHETAAQFTNSHHRPLYDIAKSERYPYKPHIGLGRVRSNSIKESLKDKTQFKALFERIQQRIKGLVSTIMTELMASESSNLAVEKFAILDLQKREYIFEFVALKLHRIDKKIKEHVENLPVTGKTA